MRHHQPKTISSIDEMPAPSPSVLAFLEAWKESRQGSLVPCKRDFDPARIPHLLPRLWIYEYLVDDDTFICRLSGERLNQAWGFSLAGKSLLEILGPEDTAELTPIWHAVRQRPLIHYGKQERFAGNILYSAERMVAPMADPQGERRFVIGISNYRLGGDGRLRPPPLLRDACHLPCSRV